jgi:glycine betaine/proline transport system substrate-binding protein
MPLDIRSPLTAILCCVPLFAQAVEPERCSQVRFADVGWTDITVTTAVTRHILNSLDYRTQVKRLSVPDTYKAMADGSIDVFLGNWMPSMENDIRPYADKGQVVSLGANLQGAKYTLAVNRTAYEGGLKSFADLAGAKQQLGAKLYGIEPGNDGNKLIQQMIDQNAFNLGDFTLVESNESSMLAQVKRAQHLKQWVVFLGWEPHPMNSDLQMNYLDGGDEFFGPDYGGATVHTNANAAFTEQCTNVTRLLKNLRFSLDMENRLMGAILDTNTNPRREAKNWLKANPQTLASWLQGVTTRTGQPAAAALGLEQNAAEASAEL